MRPTISPACRVWRNPFCGALIIQRKPMTFRLFIPLTIFVGMLQPTRAYSQKPSPESLLKISNGTYLAFQAKDWTTMQTLTTPDFTYVGSEGILSGRDLGVATKDCELRSFTLGSPRIKVLSSTSATLTYIAHQDESCAGKPLPSILLNADVFVRRNGKWVVSTHMEATATGQMN